MNNEQMTIDPERGLKELIFKHLDKLYYKMPQNDNISIVKTSGGNIVNYIYEDHRGYKCLMTEERAEYQTIYYFANSPEHQPFTLKDLLGYLDNLFEVYGVPTGN